MINCTLKKAKTGLQDRVSIPHTSPNAFIKDMDRVCGHVTRMCPDHPVPACPDYQTSSPIIFNFSYTGEQVVDHSTLKTNLNVYEMIEAPLRHIMREICLRLHSVTNESD